ncbi:hypothetical protein HY642_01225 [Candidatus Woesearchaeota archaeon]|nr:hypothetical protein [Candidatus Woesearchaeota archaeon]
MALIDEVRNIKKLRENLVVVEFTNTYSIAMERQSPQSFAETNHWRQADTDQIVYNHLPISNYRGHGNLAWCLSDDPNNRASVHFSMPAGETLDKVVQESENNLRRLYRESRALYNEMVQPLDIKPASRRQWSAIFAPFTFPFQYIALAMDFARKSRNHTLPANTDGYLGLAFGPFYYPHAIGRAFTELVQPSLRRKRVRNASLLSADKDAGPAIEFSCNIGDKDTGPHNFDFITLHFPLRRQDKEYAAYEVDDILDYDRSPMHSRTLEDYSNAKHHLDVPPALVERMHDCERRIHEEEAQYYGFVRSIKPDDVKALAQNIGLYHKDMAAAP